MIEARLNESNVWQMFDTRSEKFLPGGCSKTEDGCKDLAEHANDVIKRGFKSIIQAADFPVYDDGYFESMIAERYLQLNPDIRDKVKEKIEGKIDKKTTYSGKRRGRKANPDKVQKPKVLGPDGKPRGRGRPKKVVEVS